MILISVVNQIIDQFQLELAGLEKVFEICAWTDRPNYWAGENCVWRRDYQ